MLIFDRIEGSWRHYESDPGGPAQQWLYGLSRPWCASAAFGAIIAREARLACALVYVPAPPDVVLSKSTVLWAAPAPEVAEGTNLYVHMANGVLLLPFERHAWGRGVRGRLGERGIMAPSHSTSVSIPAAPEWQPYRRGTLSIVR
jgi:hypothetical protein